MINKKYLAILVFIFLALLIIMLYLMSRSQKIELELKAVYPADLAENQARDVNIILIFDRNLSQEYINLVKVTTEPNFEFTKEIYAPNSLILKYDELEYDTKYQLSVYFADELMQAWSFTTEKLVRIADPELMQKFEDNKEYYPLSKFLPTNQQFDIRYIGKLTIQVKLNGVDKDAVLAFIRSKGVDPETHKIYWVDFSL